MSTKIPIAPRMRPSLSNRGAAVFNQRHAPAIGPEHVDDDAVDLAAFDRGQAHRPCVGRERLAVFRDREGGVSTPGCCAVANVLSFNPTSSAKARLKRMRAAGGIVGDADADRQHVEDGFDLGGAVLQIDTEFANELDRLRGHRWGPGFPHVTPGGGLRAKGGPGPLIRVRMGCGRVIRRGAFALRSPSPSIGLRARGGAVW